MPSPTTPTTKPWRRYVAVGDSFTEGMVDPDPQRPDEFIGWADRLAQRLAADRDGERFDYANLAVRGRLLDDVVGPQLDTALSMRPDLVSIVGGGNDILRPHADLDAIADRLEAAVIRLREAGCDVILATTADPGSAPVLKVVRPRCAIHATNVWAIAQRHGCFVIDMFSMRALRDPRMWGADRIHLSSEGHTRVAAQALWALNGGHGERPWSESLEPQQLSVAEAIGGHAAWVAGHLAPWVRRRLQGRSSGDARTAKRPQLAPVVESIADAVPE
nr:SGNH/GDSL hydrolase family protein [Rudaeicoccus suwonensis]